MTRDLAKIKTIEKFTNLLDGSLLPGCSVSQVISYYDAMILGPLRIIFIGLTALWRILWRITSIVWLQMNYNITVFTGL